LRTQWSTQEVGGRSVEADPPGVEEEGGLLLGIPGFHSMIRQRMMQCSVGEGGLTIRSRARAGLCGPACLASCSHVQPLGLSMSTDKPCADNGIGLLLSTVTLPHLHLRLYQLQACSTCRGSCSRASKPVDSEAEWPALLHSDAFAASAPGARKMRTKSPFDPPPKAKTQGVQRRLRCFRTPSFLLLD
jgi:hypothetical protein